MLRGKERWEEEEKLNKDQLEGNAILSDRYLINTLFFPIKTNLLLGLKIRLQIAIVIHREVQLTVTFQVLILTSLSHYIEVQALK